MRVFLPFVIFSIAWSSIVQAQANLLDLVASRPDLTQANKFIALAGLTELVGNANQKTLCLPNDDALHILMQSRTDVYQNMTNHAEALVAVASCTRFKLFDLISKFILSMAFLI